MEPATATNGAPPHQPSPGAKKSADVKMLTTKAVVAYTEFLTAVVAAVTPTPDAKRSPAEAIGGGVAKFEAAMNDLREGVRSKRRKIDSGSHKATEPAGAAVAPAAAAAGVARTTARGEQLPQKQKELDQALATISAIVEKLDK